MTIRRDEEVVLDAHTLFLRDQCLEMVADEAGRRVFVDQLARGRAVDAEFVLKVTNAYLLRSFRDEQAQAATVGDVRLTFARRAATAELPRTR